MTGCPVGVRRRRCRRGDLPDAGSEAVTPASAAGPAARPAPLPPSASPAAGRGRSAPLRVGSGRALRPVPREPACPDRTAMELTPDTRTRRAGLFRLPLEPDHLAVVLECGAGVVARPARRRRRPLGAELQ